MILNFRYGLSFVENIENTDKKWEEVEEIDGSLLLENTKYLPLGFIVKKELAEYTADSENSFISQNEFFRRATGLEGDLFKILDTTTVNYEGYGVIRQELGKYYLIRKEDETYGTLRWNYSILTDGMYYVYCAADSMKSYEVQVSGGRKMDRNVSAPYFYLSQFDNCNSGEIVTITTKPSAETGYATVYFARINQDLLNEGYNLLGKETLKLTKFSDTSIKGEIITEGGLLYTSLPYNKNWQVRVDGERKEIKIIGNCMISVELETGEHEVEFRYWNQDFVIGTIISILSLIIFIFLVIKSKKP
jgi:hypothetical protein